MLKDLVTGKRQVGTTEPPFPHAARPFAQDERGTLLPVMAAVLMVATAGAALAVDLARGYALKSDLQSAADSAALAAAIMLPDQDQAMQAAAHVVSKNLPGYPDILQPEDFSFGIWDGESRSIDEQAGTASAVRVTVRLNQNRGNGVGTLFAGILGTDLIDIASSAVAGKRGVACLLTLEEKDKSLEIQGDASLQLNGCGAQVNSTDHDAFEASGHARMISDSICVTGGAKVDKSADVSPQPSEGCPPHVDPMESLVMPDVNGCTELDAEYKDMSVTLRTGHVFCDGLKISGDSHLILLPGLYVIEDGKLIVEDNAILEGDGVTILLYGEDAEIEVKDKASLRLAAPKEGAMQGLLIVQSEGNTKDNKWDSSAMSELTGVVYLPNGKFTSLIEANITGTEACFVLIAKKIKIEGKANMSIDLTSTACKASLPSAFSRSVGLLD